MFRPGLFLCTAIIAVCALPSFAGASDLRSPDARDAAEHRGLYAIDEPLRPPLQDLRSPDARDAARDLPETVVIPAPAASRDTPAAGFDWGDAGIGAAGVVALLCAAAGSLILLVGVRRRRPVRTAH